MRAVGRETIDSLIDQLHLELLIDQFDVLMNLQHRVSDPTLATAADICAITVSEQNAFRHGLVCQVDRSQGHLKRPADGLNTKNGDSMNAKPGGKQPHFRHTFAPLPPGNTHWQQCRQALCTTGCLICQDAVARHGHHPTFQSIGRKGSKQVLTERGISTTGMKARDQMVRLDQESDWGQTKSQLQELFESRGHFLLVGVACHAELAYKEHGWARLKQQVKPLVDGSMSTLRELVCRVLKEIRQPARLQDAKRCRTVMEAYRQLAERGEVATAEGLKLWEKKHRRHRGVHCSETAALLTATGLAAPEKDARVVQKLKAQAENKEWLGGEQKKNQRRWQYLKRRAANQKKSFDAASKENAKKRREEWLTRKRERDPNFKQSKRIKKKMTCSKVLSLLLMIIMANVVGHCGGRPLDMISYDTYSAYVLSSNSVG